MEITGEASAAGEEKGTGASLSEDQQAGAALKRDETQEEAFRKQQAPPPDEAPTPSKEGQGGEAYEPDEDAGGKQQEPGQEEEEDQEEGEEEEVQQQQQQQEEEEKKAAALRKQEDPHLPLRRAGSSPEDAEAPLASVDDCVAALRSLPGGDAALPQIADIVAEFRRSYVTVPGYHKHTSRKVSEWIRACKHALHRAWLHAAAAGAASRPPYNTPSFSSSSPLPPPPSASISSSPAVPCAAAPIRPPPFPSRRAGLAVESCIMSGIHDAVFGSVAKWAGPRDAELAAVMRWLQEGGSSSSSSSGGGGGGGRGGGADEEALRRVCGVPDRLLSADLGPAASRLSSMLSCRCPLEMMCCLRGANHAILRAVADVSREEERRRREERRLELLEQREEEEAEEAWGGGDEEEEMMMRRSRGEEEELRQVSADELLPLFIASLAAARPPQVFSALEYLLTFHQEGDLHGHGGYMLAMLEASMQFLLQFHAKGLVNRQRLGAPAASSSFLSSASLQMPHHHQGQSHHHHGPGGASAASGALEPPPGLSVHPVDDGPPADPRADSLPSLTLMGGDYSSIDRASKIFFNSIGKRHLGSGTPNPNAAAADGGTVTLLGLGDLGLATAGRVSSAPWDVLQQGQGQGQQQQQDDPGVEDEVEEASAAAADAAENQFPRLRIDLSLPQQQQDDPPLFPLCGGGSHQQESGDSNRGSMRGANSPTSAAAGATRCSSSSRIISGSGGGGAPNGHQQQKQKQIHGQPVVTASSPAFRPPAIISARADAPENPSAGLGSFLSGLRSKGEAASGSSRMRL